MDKKCEIIEYQVDNSDLKSYIHLFSTIKCNDCWHEILDKQNWPMAAALKLKIPVGTIGCPHCGVVSHGALSQTCGMCDKNYWEKVNE